MKIKNAKFVSRSMEINQEFYFAAEDTKMNVNDIYNSSWFGSVLWDLFSPAAVKLESSYNRSIKVILELPHATHRGLIEPLSGRRHVKRIFLKRFLTMISSIRKSKKTVLLNLLRVSEKRTTSTTGRNLRNIMLILGESCIEKIEIEKIYKFPYFPLPKEEA